MEEDIRWRRSRRKSRRWRKKIGGNREDEEWKKMQWRKSIKSNTRDWSAPHTRR